MSESMRTVLLLAASVISFAAVACGDAGQTNIIDHRAKGATTGTEDPNAPHDPSTSDIGDTNTTDTPPTTPDKPADPGTSAASFDVAVSNATPATDLGTKVSFDVTVTPKQNFTGAVTLDLTGLPTGVTHTFTPASISITGAAPVKSTVELDVAYSAPTTPSGSSVPLVVKATAGSVSSTANVNFKVNAHMTMYVPMNANALRSTNTIYRDQWGGPEFGANPKPLLTQSDNPINILVKNADSVPQEVHSGATFGHGAGLIQPGQYDQVNGQTRVRKLNVGNSVNGYLHNDGATTGDGKGVAFQISVQASP